MNRPPPRASAKIQVPTKPVPPSSPKVPVATVASENKVLVAIAALDKKVELLGIDAAISNESQREHRKAFAALVPQFEALVGRMEKAEAKIEASTGVDAELRQSITGTHALAELALAAAEAGRDESCAQTPMLAKVDAQTKSPATTTIAVAIVNLVLGLVWLVYEILTKIPRLP